MSRLEKHYEAWEKLREQCFINDALPVYQHKTELIEAIKNNRILIIAGETGSGKTTQIPKCCLLAGLGQNKKILLTQPRRIAAMSTCKRIASEHEVKVGEEIGYRIRFDHRVSENTVLEVVTDGIPLSGELNKLQFKNFDCVILDEVHERSINLDLLTGLLKREMQHNPNLKLILMSATIDIEQYLKYLPEAKAFQIEGRTFPVSTSYFETSNPYSDTATKLSNALQENLTLCPSGDILCFMPTERDITEAVKKLSSNMGNKYEILPLYSRLSKQQQEAVFKTTAKAKIIIATNIAETSITLPNVKMVIDSGLVRLMRYQSGRGIPLLQIESISKASAQQRMGRAGRTGPGVCVRMYSEKEYDSFEDYTSPEIKRSDLSGVILKLIGLGVEDPEKFDFLEKPTSKSIKHSLDLLLFLKAVIKTEANSYRITAEGREMSRLPLSPRLAHLMLEAQKKEVLYPISIITAFLSIKDPRLEPAEYRDKAREIHRSRRVDSSDYLGYLVLFKLIKKQRDLLSNTAFRKWCHKNYLSWLGIREWEQLTIELATTLSKNVFKKIDTINEVAIHKIILGSHLDHLLQMDKTEKGNVYTSLSRTEISIHPSSVLSLNKPEWAVCSSFLSTSRLYALHCMSIHPNWVIELASHAVKSHRGPPWYDEQSQKVVSEEKIFFHNHHLKTHARKDHFQHNPEEATELFIQEAILGNKIELASIEEALKIHDKLKNYDAANRMREVYFNQNNLIDAWKKQIGLCSRYSDLKKNKPEELHISLQDCLPDHDLEELEYDFPTELNVGRASIKIDYHYDVNSDNDGASFNFQERHLADIDPYTLDLAIPGFYEQRLEKAFDCLPKDFKQHFEKVEILELWKKEHCITNKALYHYFQLWISRHTSRSDLHKSWLEDIKSKTPIYLIPNIIVRDNKNKISAQSRNFEVIKTKFKKSLLNREIMNLRKNTGTALKDISDLNDPDSIFEAGLPFLEKYWQQSESVESDDQIPDIYLSLHTQKGSLVKEINTRSDKATSKNIQFCIQYAIIPNFSSLPKDHYKSFFLESDLAMEVEHQNGFVLQIMPAILEKLRKQDFQNRADFNKRIEKIISKNLSKTLKKSMKILAMSNECKRNLNNVIVYSSYKHILERTLLRTYGRETKIDTILKNGSLNWCYTEISFLLELSRIYNREKDMIHADEQINDWLTLKKTVLEFNLDPMTEQQPDTYWLSPFIENNTFEADQHYYQHISKIINHNHSQLNTLKKELSNSEHLLQKYIYDLKSESNEKIKTKKEDLLESILEKFPEHRPKKEHISEFIESVKILEKQWKPFIKSQTKIMHDEKSVDKKKLAEMLGSAWKTK